VTAANDDKGPAAAEAFAAGRMSPKRREHARRVAALAAEYAARFGASPDDGRAAGLLHDLCRNMSGEELLAAAAELGVPVGPCERQQPVALLHGPVAAAELAAAGWPPDITRAIALHTVGAGGMTTLEKCLYLADFSEPGRDFPGLSEVRDTAQRSLDDAVAAAVRVTIVDLVEKRRGVAGGAIDLYNELHGAC
jgi:predicted HD superfamily hydrolase involved in NAD metabolism